LFQPNGAVPIYTQVVRNILASFAGGEEGIVKHFSVIIHEITLLCFAAYYTAACRQIIVRGSIFCRLGRFLVRSADSTAEDCLGMIQQKKTC